MFSIVPQIFPIGERLAFEMNCIHIYINFCKALIGEFLDLPTHEILQITIEFQLFFFLLLKLKLKCKITILK